MPKTPAQEAKEKALAKSKTNSKLKIEQMKKQTRLMREVWGITREELHQNQEQNAKIRDIFANVRKSLNNLEKTNDRVESLFPEE